MESEQKAKSLPERRFSAGGVSAAIWNNESSKDGQTYAFKTVSLQRAYQKDGAWQHTTTLRANDVPKAKLVLEKAYDFLVAGTRE